MATEREDEVLISVTLDEAGTEKRIVDLRKQLTFLKEAAAGLKKDFKEGAIGGDEFEGAMERIQHQTTVLNKELAQQRKALVDNEKQQKASTGSLAEMRAKLSLLTAGYVELSKSERDNADVGGVLQQRIKALSDELKENEQKLGDHRRSVGDYAKGIRIAGVSVGEMQEAVKGGVEGFKTFTAGISLSRGALIALAAIPILLILTGLVALLTKSQAGMDKLAQFTKAADLAISALTDGFVRVGRAALEFLSPSTFTSLDNLKSRFNNLKDSILGVADNMKEAAKAGYDIAAVNQQIEASEIKVGVVRARNRAEIERLKKLAEDTSQSNAVRQSAAKKAYDLENSTLQVQTKLQQQRIDNLKREINLNETTRTNRAKQKELADEEIKLAELSEESLGRQTELNNNLNSIRVDGIAKAKEAAALAAKESIAEAERALIRAKQKGEDALAIEEEIIRRRAKADKLAVEKGAQQRLLIEAKAAADILALHVNHALEVQKRTLSIQQSEISASLALARRGSAEVRDLQIREIRRATQEQIAELEAANKKKEITQEQYNERLADLQNSSNRAIDDVRTQFEQSEINRLAELGKLRIQTTLDLSENLLAIRRNEAVEAIAIEEKQQLDLLKLQEIGEDERATREAAIQAAAQVKRKQVYAQIMADERAHRRALLEQTLYDTVAGTKEELDVRKRLLALQLEDELANIELDEEQKAAIRAKYRAEERNLQKAYNKQVYDDIVATVSLAKDTLSTAFEAQTQTLLSNLDKQQAAAVRSAGANVELRTRIEEQYQKKREKIEKEAAEKRRKIASIENLIATAQATTAALTLFARNPILGAITEGLILVKALKAQALIDTQEFNQGGYFQTYTSDRRGAYVRGPGTGTSDSINARISNGESILNARSTSMFYSELSAMNVAGGGRAFPGAGGDPVPQVSNFVYGGVPQSGSADITSAVIAGLKGANIAVAVTDIHHVESDLTYARSQGNV